MERLAAQEFDGEVELIVVNNGSTDDTAEVAREYGARVIELAQANFSYPRSLNMGVEAARAPVVACIVAHAYPESPHWIEAGLRHFANEKVAGVFSYTLPHRDATVWDRIVAMPAYIWGWLRGPVHMRNVRPSSGTFGATNIMLRRSLWAKHPFDESYGAGGEDTAWAMWAEAEGYKIVRDPKFTVRHSHYLKSFDHSVKQAKVWINTKNPRPFDAEEIRFRGPFGKR